MARRTRALTTDVESTARDSSLRRGMIASLFYRATSAVTPILVIPVALDALGREIFGLWMAVTAATSFLAFSDLGLGNSLMTNLSRMRAEGKSRSELTRTVGASYGLLLLVAAAISTAAFVVVWMTPWASLIGWDSSAELNWITTVCVSVFMANVPVSLVIRVMFAFQQAPSSYYFQSVGPMLSLIGAYATHAAGFSSAVFVLAATGGPLIANVVCSVLWFGRSNSLDFRPFLPDRSTRRAIFRLGGGFLVISVLMAAATNIDLLLIPSMLDASTATDYAVPWRIFSQLGMILSLMSLPFWPAAGDALARGEREWIRHRARRLMRLNLIVLIPGSCGLVVFGPTLLQAWVGTDVVPNRVLLACLGGWWCLMAAMYPYFMVQNAAGILRPQIYGWAAFLVVSVAARVMALREDLWTVLPLVSAGCYLVTLLPAAYVGYRRALAPAAESAERSTSV